MFNLCDQPATAGQVVASGRAPESILQPADVATGTSIISGIELGALPPGKAVVVETRNSRYRFVTLDRSGQNVMAQGGHYFPEPTVARIEGSARGESPVTSGWIELGLSLELSVRGDRILTSGVQSISLDSSTVA